MGSIQYQDSRTGEDVASARVGRTVSGHGVVPDVVVTQKLSDLLQGKDTTLLAAQAWLTQAP
jgi:C-terminal processing protease CtpA/Prc